MWMCITELGTKKIVKMVIFMVNFVSVKKNFYVVKMSKLNLGKEAFKRPFLKLFPVYTIL